MKHCPGVKSFVSPQIVVKICPFCGEEVEFFEFEAEQICPKCGGKVRREASESCISWCSYADQCIRDLEEKGLISRERAEILRGLMNKTRKAGEGKPT